jgi:uncharacterized membrane protein
MNRTIESLLRFVNVTTSGLLAGSLGFGEAALVPGWERERPQGVDARPSDQVIAAYFNAIGPVALATSITLAIGTGDSARLRRLLDSVSAIGLAGVLAATIMVTVPINQKLEEEAPADYARDQSYLLARNWSRAHAFRTSLGIGAFLCAAAANIPSRARR